MVAKKKNMEGGMLGLFTKNYSNLEDVFKKLKHGDSILNKLRIEQRLRGFLQVLAKKLQQYSDANNLAKRLNPYNVKNEDKYQELYDMFIQICEKYPSEIRKIQEKEQITLGSRNNKNQYINQYIYKPFYYVLFFFMINLKVTIL